MTVTILNANHPQYWIDVKRRASIRKACKIVEEELNWLKSSYDLYEHYICEINRILHSVAKSVGINDDAAFAEMKVHCVEEFELPTTILYTTEAELEADAADAADAVKWAIDCDRLMGL